LREQNAAGDTRICGLNAFNPEQGSLFLPRLLWRRTAGNATLRLQLWSDIASGRCPRRAGFLQQLQPARPIRPLSVQVEHETHQPQQAEWLKLIRRATTIARGDFEKWCSRGQPICSLRSALTLSR
jgi:menaquinone-specific isochorismate synthase